MDQIGQLLVPFATLTAAVWGLTEMLPRAVPPLRRLTRQLLALLLGPALGVAAAGTGLIDLAYGAAALMGVVSTVLAGVAHDKIAKPLTPSKPGP